MDLSVDLQCTDGKCDGDLVGASPDVAVTHQRLIHLASISRVNETLSSILYGVDCEVEGKKRNTAMHLQIQ